MPKGTGRSRLAARKRAPGVLARASAAGHNRASQSRRCVLDAPAFVRFGWLHRPASLVGWLITACAIAYMARVFVAIDAHAHSVSDLLHAVYPHWGVTFLGWDWLARRMSAVTG